MAYIYAPGRHIAPWEGKLVQAKTRFGRGPVEYGAETYLPINIDAVRVDSSPAFDLYFRPGAEQPFVLYCERNTPFTAEARKRLIVNQVDQLYIRKAQAGDYHRYLAENIEDILKDKKLSAREKSGILYDSAQAVVQEVLADPASRENVQRGKNIAGQTVAFMTAEDFKLEQLIRTISCDYYLYTHSVNVVAYSVALAMRSGIKDRATLREIANGALLHDAGKAKISPAILNKESGLTSAEWEKIKQVPVIGHDMIRASNCIGEIALDVILHHQEKLNGRGYPEGLKDAEISPFVRIVAIADIFDALTSDRFHQKQRSSFEALQLMQKDMKQEIDQDLFRLFVEMMGNP